jgi:hypothetical protein
MSTSKQEQARLSSIGLDQTGEIIARLFFPDGSRFDIRLNPQDLARLAGKGVRILNGV